MSLPSVNSGNFFSSTVPFLFFIWIHQGFTNAQISIQQLIQGDPIYICWRFYSILSLLYYSAPQIPATSASSKLQILHLQFSGSTLHAPLAFYIMVQKLLPSESQGDVGLSLSVSLLSWITPLQGLLAHVFQQCFRYVAEIFSYLQQEENSGTNYSTKSRNGSLYYLL